MSKKRVWRPLNTWGIYALGITTGSVIVYTILELGRACSAL
jgi:hypothetical protein